jgi:NADP-reducing hydrogenase subunit HndD
MVKLTIDNKEVSVKEGTTILNAAKQLGINIPTLCYLKDVNEIGACRVCVVEIEGSTKLSAACNTVVNEGMVVHTNSARVRQARKYNIEMILSQHNCHCPTCLRSGNCSLQRMANNQNIYNLDYDTKVDEMNWDMSFPLIRDNSKCIKCMRCVTICEKTQGIGVWEVNGTGANMTITTRDGLNIKETNCTLCGQCITHCPVGALRERDDTGKVLSAIYDPEKITVVQLAPAVRTAWSEMFKLPKEKSSVNRLVACLHALGINYVFDTDFSADLTVMEEGTEFINNFKKHKPLMTSCCPGWVRFLIKEYPDMLSHLSSAKSPQQMFGAVAKTYFAKKLDVDASKIFSISIMPCTAKKYECAVPEVSDSGAGQDVDVVLTTRELTRLLRACHIDPESLEDEPFDSPMGLGTGAGVIFGATGGVMEAALRTSYFLLTGKNPDPDAFKEVRGMDGWKEASFDIKGVTIKVAVASGLSNARKLVEAIRNGEVDYDFVEIMACPGGCAGGGGQPIQDGKELAERRGETLYEIDANSCMRFSHENTSIQQIYNEFFEAPLSDVSHHLLHTVHNSWTLDKE